MYDAPSDAWIAVLEHGSGHTPRRWGNTYDNGGNEVMANWTADGDDHRCAQKCCTHYYWVLGAYGNHSKFGLESLLVLLPQAGSSTRERVRNTLIAGCISQFLSNGGLRICIQTPGKHAYLLVRFSRIPQPWGHGIFSILRHLLRIARPF